MTCFHNRLWRRRWPTTWAMFECVHCMLSSPLKEVEDHLSYAWYAYISCPCGLPFFRQFFFNMLCYQNYNHLKSLSLVYMLFVHGVSPSYGPWVIWFSKNKMGQWNWSNLKVYLTKRLQWYSVTVVWPLMSYDILVRLSHTRYIVHVSTMHVVLVACSTAWQHYDSY